MHRFYCILLFLTLMLGPTFSSQARETGYPKKRIVWIVPYPPGGGYDTYSRVIAKILPKHLPNRVNVAIRNVSGAGGRRGSAVLYRAKPDGYTIGMLNPIGLITSDLVKKSTHYDLTEYTYLATFGRGVAGIYVRSDSEFKTIEDMQKAARVKFATSGYGSSTWVWGMLAKGILNIPVHMVSGYLGSSDYITGLIRKDVDAIAIGFSSALIPYCQAGDIKPLLIFSSKPMSLLPEVPTLKGTPYEELENLSNIRAIAGPPGLPDEISGILQKSLLNALNDPDLEVWSKKTKNPLYIRNASDTLISIKECMELVEKYEKFFKD